LPYFSCGGGVINIVPSGSIHTGYDESQPCCTNALSSKCELDHLSTQMLEELGLCETRGESEFEKPQFEKQEKLK
jgi:hypothetical protein